MSKSRRFILLTSENGKVVPSEPMNVEKVLQELLHRGAAQLPVAACWMREANRADHYESDGIVIFCVSGKRALSAGKISTLFACLSDN